MINSSQKFSDASLTSNLEQVEYADKLDLGLSGMGAEDMARKGTWHLMAFIALQAVGVNLHRAFKCRLEGQYLVSYISHFL